AVSALVVSFYSRILGRCPNLTLNAAPLARNANVVSHPTPQIKYPVPSAFLRAKFVSCEEFTGSRNQHRREPCDSLVDCFGGGGVCLRDPRDRAASHIFDRSRTVVRLALYVRGHCACYFWHSFGERYFDLAYVHCR